jgi:hypothetical protein
VKALRDLRRLILIKVPRATTRRFRSYITENLDAAARAFRVPAETIMGALESVRDVASWLPAFWRPFVEPRPCTNERAIEVLIPSLARRFGDEESPVAGRAVQEPLLLLIVGPVLSAHGIACTKLPARERRDTPQTSR